MTGGDQMTRRNFLGGAAATGLAFTAHSDFRR
ncbi:MAG: hypothetical protein CVT86_06280 [Alphaproteobacteria bacterium HGW-Alphaproteobacteria-8]|nr:MAG: hypothetical protein CVT86_06280 [Alphaproteobacteria bacterium HGW-Alphaproteobacteria-8]